MEGFGFLYKLYNVCFHGVFQGNMRVGIFMMFRFKEHCMEGKGWCSCCFDPFFFRKMTDSVNK